MPAYVIVGIDVHDPAAYEDSKSVAYATVVRYGGRYIARGGAAEQLEGTRVRGTLHHGLVVTLARTSTAAALATLIGVVNAVAQSAPKETLPDAAPNTATSATEVRHHFKVLSPAQIDDYAATEIRSLSEKCDKVRMIVESAQGKKFLFSSERDYVKQTTEHACERC